MNRKRRKGQRIRTSYIWAGIMSVCALAALFAAVWVVMTVYETIVGDSSQWTAESSAAETSELEIDAEPVAGWITEDGGTRYLDDEGNYLSDQWIVSAEKLYYLDADGYMAVDDVSMDGQVFSFNEDGVLTDIQLDTGWAGLTGDDNLQNLDSLVKSNAFWCYLGSDADDTGIFRPIYYRKTTETEANVLGSEENPEMSTHNSLQIHDGYIYYLPQVTSQTLSSLSPDEQKLCNRLYRMKPGDSEKELLAENATGFLVLDDGSVYYASDGQIQKAEAGTVYSVGEAQYRVLVKDNACYLVDASGEPVSGDSSGNQVVGDRLYDLNQDGRINGVYPADRTYDQAEFTLEQNSSGVTALYRMESGGTKEVIAQSDYGINSFCIADGMIYYSAYIRRDADGSRYSAIFQIAPDGSGNRQISQSFQGNILNLYYYPEKGKIYGEYTPVSWRNCYGQIVVIDLDGTVNVIDDSASRGSGVMENNDLLSLVMVEGNTITTYLRSCSYSRSSGSWTVLSEKPYQFSDTLQVLAASSAEGGITQGNDAAGINGSGLETEGTSEAESTAPSSEAETTVPAGTQPAETRPSATSPAETSSAPTNPAPTSPAPTAPAPAETEGSISGGPGYENEGSLQGAGPGGEDIPIIEANPESGNNSGQVEFVGPGYQ
ncbi:MAG TPA: hypothetical protein IAB60_08935 [Candidatus Caccovicinus merdipullorum]|uniref:Prolow-density lipoprotein receptor-related protein 1-like beta-propeller domain-containing protein n=1 Tax=Candidatus Caccovicinus merdipullorum TaxID=2840724 RepID=A0A9D1GLA8_9FIRM|nr:hypothetical protein [Candidatus Caccovicinus merdipullorum]